MFESTGAFALFDYFRVPYEQKEKEAAGPSFASLSVRGESAALSWPLEAGFAEPAAQAATFWAAPQRLWAAGSYFKPRDLLSD